jgi:two-component system, chemotaxis family, protein-glutamate methylesterase/glutaminase
MTSVVRVLVVDDSAYVRKVVKQMLSRSPYIDVVGTARDGEEALELAEELRPDVITCDLIMPNVDGVEFVRAQMARRPVPIIIISIANQASEQVLAALDSGAIDFVQKPTALATDKLLEIGDELIEKVKVAAQSPVRDRPLRVVSDDAPVAISVPRRAASPNRPEVIVIGTSTGGPQALKFVIPRLPADCPAPVAMVLHMPVGYTEMYARKLDEMSGLRVIECQGGEEVTSGTAYLAPAGRHLTFKRDGEGVVRTHLDARPLDLPHRPSVDVLFHSAADVYGDRVLAIVLTGMGADGREGAAWVKAKGGSVITEAEESCVVYGMPRSIVEAGLSDHSASLEDIPHAIMDRL